MRDSAAAADPGAAAAPGGAGPRRDEGAASPRARGRGDGSGGAGGDGGGTSGDGGHDPGGRRPDDRELGDIARSLAEGAGESMRAARDSATALGRLLRADLALARSSLLLGALLALTAISFVGAAWLLLVALAVVALDRAGLPLPAAIALAAGASLLMALLAAWLARRAFAGAGLAATRRQLARLRGGDEARDGVPVPGNEGARDDDDPASEPAGERAP